MSRGTDIADLAADPAPGNDGVELLCLEVAGQRCALPVDVVVEIHPAVQLAPLPDAPEVVVGLLNRRGRAIPVLSLRRRLGLPARPVQVGEHLVVVRTAEREVALLVDSAVDIAEVPGASIDAAVTHAAEALRSTGVAVLPEGLLVILDVDTFLSPGEAMVLDEALQQTLLSPP